MFRRGGSSYVPWGVFHGGIYAHMPVVPYFILRSRCREISLLEGVMERVSVRFPCILAQIFS